MISTSRWFLSSQTGAVTSVVGLLLLMGLLLLLMELLVGGQTWSRVTETSAGLSPSHLALYWNSIT